MLRSPKLYGKSHKVVFIGQATVGKSSIIRRVFSNEFDPESESTIGAAYTKIWIPITKYDTSIPIEIWDTAGQERFNSLIPMYLKETEAVFAIFDVTCDHSYEMLKVRWLPLIMNTCHRLPLIYCCANKVDLLKTDKEHEEVDRKLNEFKEIINNCRTFKTSAKTDVGINEAFSQLSLDFYQKLEDASDSSSDDTIDFYNNTESYTGCCMTG